VDSDQMDALQIVWQGDLRRWAEDREEWRHLSREARAPEGAVAPYVDGRNTKVIEKFVKNIYVNFEDP
jgi:hypothetical protein